MEGDITNNATIVFHTGEDFGGVISGSGNVIVDTYAGFALTGDSTYTGGTSVNSPGIFAINGSVQGQVTVNAGGQLSGSGRIGGNLLVADQGTVSPGPDLRSTAILSVGSLSLSNGTGPFNFGSSLQIDLAGLVRGTSYDAIDCESTANLAGVLGVEFTYPFVGTAGNTFDILDAHEIHGEYTRIELPSLTSGLAWDTTRLYTDGILSIVSTVPEPASASLLMLGAIMLLRRMSRHSFSLKATANA
jgi:hypothetical protein